MEKISFHLSFFKDFEVCIIYNGIDIFNENMRFARDTLIKGLYGTGMDHEKPNNTHDGEYFKLMNETIKCLILMMTAIADNNDEVRRTT